VYSSIYDFATGRGMSLSEVVELAMNSLNGNIDKDQTVREKYLEERNHKRKFIYFNRKKDTSNKNV
jgi:GDP-D-mannose dehydratase